MANFFANIEREQNSDSFLDRYKPKEKKKFAHSNENSSSFYKITEIMEPMNNQEINVLNEMECGSKKTNQKTLTWRSPLVFSPTAKFSPQNISHYQGRSDEGSQIGICNESLESMTTKKKYLSLNFQKSPKKAVLSQNPFNKRPCDRQFFLSDKHYGNVNDYKSDIRRELDDKYTGDRKQERNEPTNLMDYYSKLTSDLNEKRKSEKISHEEEITKKKNIIKFQPTLESQVYSPRGSGHSIKEPYKIIKNSPKQSENSRPSNTALFNTQASQQTNQALNCSDYLNSQINMQIGSSSQIRDYFSAVDTSHQEKCFKQNMSSTMPLLKICKNNYNQSLYHVQNMHPSEPFVTKYCGPECDCEIIRPNHPHCSLISTTLNENLNNTNHHLTTDNRDSTYLYNSDSQKNNYFTEKTANISFLQNGKTLQHAQDFYSHDGNAGYNCRILPQRNICRIDNIANASFHEDTQSKWESVSCSQRPVMDEGATIALKQEYFNPNDTNQRMYPLNQYVIRRNIPMTRTSTYDDEFHPKCIDVCNCQICFNYQNPNSNYPMRMFSQMPPDPYAHQSPYFQNPSTMQNAHFFNNPYFNQTQFGHHYKDVVPSMYYKQGNDKEYVMNKFLCSLSPNL